MGILGKIKRLLKHSTRHKEISPTARRKKWRPSYATYRLQPNALPARPPKKKSRKLVLAPLPFWERMVKKSAFSQRLAGWPWARRRRALDRAFVPPTTPMEGLLSAIKATGVKCNHTHGYTDIFAQYLREQGWNAAPKNTIWGGNARAAAAEWNDLPNSLNNSTAPIKPIKRSLAHPAENWRCLWRSPFRTVVHHDPLPPPLCGWAAEISQLPEWSLKNPTTSGD